MLAPARTEMVFIPADPPRQGRLALWSPGSARPPTDPPGGVLGQVELVTPTGPRDPRPRRRRIQARLLDIPAALALFSEPSSPRTEPGTASERAWSAAVLAGVCLVARGRVLPSLTTAGHGAWHVGPLDDTDRAWLRALVAALPATAYAVPVPGSRPVRLVDPQELVRACWDAIADTLARSSTIEPASPSPTNMAAGLAAFAAPAPMPVPGATDWLTDGARAERTGARVVLRIEPPVACIDGDFHAALALRSVADPSLLIDVGDLWQAPAAVLARLGPEAETDLLLGLRRGARAWPPLASVLDAATPASLALPDEALEALFGSGAQALAGAGIEVLWPAELFADPLRLRGSARSAPTPAGAVAGFSMDQLLEFTWRPAPGGDGGEPLTDAEVAVLAEAKRPVVRLRGRWIRADPALLERLRRGRTRPLRAIEALAAALSGTVDIDGERVDFGVEGGLGELASLLAATAGDGPWRRSARRGSRRTARPAAPVPASWVGLALADDLRRARRVPG